MLNLCIYHRKSGLFRPPLPEMVPTQLRGSVTWIVSSVNLAWRGSVKGYHSNLAPKLMEHPNSKTGVRGGRYHWPQEDDDQAKALPTSSRTDVHHSRLQRMPSTSEHANTELCDGMSDRSQFRTQPGGNTHRGLVNHGNGRLKQNRSAGHGWRPWPCHRSDSAGGFSLGQIPLLDQRSNHWPSIP